MPAALCQANKLCGIASVWMDHSFAGMPAIPIHPHSIIWCDRRVDFLKFRGRGRDAAALIMEFADDKELGLPEQY